MTSERYIKHPTPMGPGIWVGRPPGSATGLVSLLRIDGGRNARSRSPYIFELHIPWNFLRLFVVFDVRRDVHIFHSHSFIFEAADVFSSCLILSDVPQAFIHKLWAFIGEPQAFSRTLISFCSADVYVGCGCLCGSQT